MFAWIKDRLSSAPNKFRITNTVADCITLHRCRTPKGPRAERLFRDGGWGVKMGYIWHLNKSREKKRGNKMMENKRQRKGIREKSTVK